MAKQEDYFQARRKTDNNGETRVGKWFECPVLTKDMSLYYYSLIV